MGGSQTDTTRNTSRGRCWTELGSHSGHGVSSRDGYWARSAEWGWGEGGVGVSPAILSDASVYFLRLGGLKCTSKWQSAGVSWCGPTALGEQAQ